MSDSIKVAVAGNPNSGKTTIFNNLTGARQHVGNYPGVTVEHKEGTLTHRGTKVQVVDLPGTYSLTAYSAEELVARNFILREKPDVVVDVLDAANLERNLYLATEIMELGVPMVLALNMSDVAANRGFRFDLQELSLQLGAPIVPTVGSRGEGMDELLDAVIAAASGLNGYRRVDVDYGPLLEPEIAAVEQRVEATASAAGEGPSRWIAIKLLEEDQEVRDRVRSPEVLSVVENSSERLGGALGNQPGIAIAEGRYEFITRACRDTVAQAGGPRRTLSDRIDGVVTNRLWGLPIFLGLMYLVFHATFTVGALPMEWIESAFGWLGEGVTGLWSAGAASPLQSLLVDGVIGGVGGVLVFLPNILLLFLAIAVLEDSGYMARAAFIMDRVMNKVGLHGKSFIPLLTGFGCSVPAIMATRTLENRRDRLTTMLVTPLMSCGARLPIYLLIIPAFFAPRWHGPMLWIIYMIGIGLAMLGAKLLRGTVFKGESAPFVMELPPYRLPTLKSVLIHMWERAWLYLKKAGTIILGISIVMWALTSYPKLPAADVDGDALKARELAHSVAGRIGGGMEPLLRPMGFDWRIGTALIGAFAAKEVFVAQMGIVYAVGEADEESVALRQKLQANYSPLVGFCIMLFCLISAPCMATIAITRRESQSWSWALLQLGGLTGLAYVLTVAAYQVGSLLRLGTA